MTSLDKARGAMEAAKERHAQIEEERPGAGDTDPGYRELTTIAQIHANIAQAEALTRIADVAEQYAGAHL